MTLPGSPSPRRWLVLLVFMLVAGLSQALWLNFAPLLPTIQASYGVDEATAGLLMLVFPLLYVFLSIPAGVLTDRKGYPFAVSLSAVVMAVSAAFRIVAMPDSGGFWLLVAAQTGMAVAQPFAVNGISKLVLDWFAPDEVVSATGLGTAGMFIGMAAGLAATPPMVEAWGMQGTMVAWTAISATIAALSLTLIRTNPAVTTPPPPEAGVLENLRPLLTSRPLLLLFGLTFLGLGYFNGLTAGIDLILKPNGIDEVHAGYIGGVLIVGGIVGAALIPLLAEKTGRRRPFIVLSVFAALLTLWPMSHSHDFTTVMVTSGLQGFFFLPAFALLLDVGSALAGQALAGAATGLLMLAGNGGGVVVMIVMVTMAQSAGNWEGAVILLILCLLGAAVGAALLPETGAVAQTTVKSTTG